MSLIHGDCIAELAKLKSDSVDFCLTDPPYGTTACKWDTVIPFDPMWKELRRVVKDNGAIALFGSEPFSSYLRMSNLKMFKYDWIWEKERPSNPILANRQALKYHEIVSIFYQKQSPYYPQMRKRDVKNKRNNKPRDFKSAVNNRVPNSKGMNETGMDDFIKPKSIIKFNMQRGMHPTQKPVPLLEYLIKTYTLEGETILDFTMGSGSTGVAAKNLNRKFIGIEKEKEYFEIATKRINV